MSNRYNVIIPIVGTLEAQVEDCHSEKEAIDTVLAAFEAWDGESDPPFGIEWEPTESVLNELQTSALPQEPNATLVPPDPVN